MNDILSRIMEIEDKAKEIAAQAETVRENLKSDIEEEINKLENQYRTEYETKLAEYTKAGEDKLLEELSRADDLHKKKLEEFKKTYSAKGEKWSKDVFEKLISR